MTSEEAMAQAKASLTDEQLKKFRLSRAEWEAGIDRLAEMGIYPDDDPRRLEQEAKCQS